MVAKAVASAVAPSVASSLKVLTQAQLGPYAPMTGSQIMPVVPATEPDGEITPQRSWGNVGGAGVPFTGGSEGAPSVPDLGGAAFRSPPIDPHYQSEAQERDPYLKVNNPPTRGMNTFIKMFQNGIALGTQNRENTGWNVRSPQQRTSVMRFAPPAHGMGFTQQTYTPRQMPVQPNTFKYPPATGTVAYGSGSPGRYTRGVLNSDTYGAGQTAGGIGGSNYTPQPGPPVTNSTASNTTNPAEPTWG
jgi:hypothetical protein